MFRSSIALSALVVTFAVTGRAQSALNPKQEFIKVNDHVYCAVGYALGNVSYVTTSAGVVVIDTTESPAAAQATLTEFRKVSQAPISYIIYTHFHGDHINGAKVFKGDGTKIIAQRRHVAELAKYQMLGAYNQRLNAIQFGASLPKEQRAVSLTAGDKGYLPPDILFDEEYLFAEGGMQFELYHTQGETVDHLMVWVPEIKTLFPGDLFYWSFPMLASPMKPDRPVQEWAASIDRMRKLKPEYLVGSHSTPQKGAEAIDTMLANYARAIRFVHDETVSRINKGLPVDEIRRQVKLPDDLAKLPYLAPNYGNVPWSVSGIYRQYTGWYDMDPAHLNPDSPLTLYRALVQAAGGTTDIVKRADKAMKEGQAQLVLELTEVVFAAEPGNRAAHALRAQALQQLGKAATNGVEKNVYLGAPQDEKK